MNKAANEAAYKKWVESHSPERIRLANKARLLLKRRTGARRTYKIKDERQVKGPRTAFSFFVSTRHATGDLKNMTFKDATKLISKEWKALPDNEKKVSIVRITSRCLRLN